MKGIQLTDFQVAINPQTDTNGKIVSGFVVGDILHQNQAILLSMHKGELKERPEMGVGISDMLLDNDPVYWKSQIRESLEMDKQTVDKIVLTQTKISIDSHY